MWREKQSGMFGEITNDSQLVEYKPEEEAEGMLWAYGTLSFSIQQHEFHSVGEGKPSMDFKQRWELKNEETPPQFYINKQFNKWW